MAIARALANDPEVILADEPTGNLDSETGKRVIGISRELAHSDGKCVVVVTHDDSIVNMSDRVYRMDDGKLTHMVLSLCNSDDPVNSGTG